MSVKLLTAATIINETSATNLCDCKKGVYSVYSYVSYFIISTCS